jgi:hypothetical protein
MASDMPITDSGVSNTLYVTSSSNFKFTSSGTSGRSEISAPKVSVVLSGTSTTCSIKGNVRGSVDGVDATLLIEGNATLTVTGVSVAIMVNGVSGCSDVQTAGVGASCKTTTETVTLTNLSCFASTNLGQISCNNGVSSAADVLFNGILAFVSAWAVVLVLC